MKNRVDGTSLRFRERMAGGSYVLAVVVALLGEFMIRGRLGMGVALLAVPCYVAVTLFTYTILGPANRSLSLLAASFNFLGLAFEAFRWNPRGVDLALVFHGAYCLLIGYVIFRSLFMPRILGLPMALAGFSWLTFLSPPLAGYLSPYNLAFGILGEAALMLWFLAFGVVGGDENDQSSAVCFGLSQPSMLRSLWEKPFVNKNGMNESFRDVRPHRTARLAGIFYMLTFLIGGIAEFASSGLVAPGDARATAANILAHESSFWLGFVAFLLVLACYIAVTGLFYELFKPVNPPLSLLAAFFSLVGCAVQASACFFYLAPLLLLKNSDNSGGVSVSELQDLAYLSLKSYGQAYGIGFVFFGFYCCLIGYFIFQSTFLPRILGVLMVAACLGWARFSQRDFPAINWW